MNQSDRKRPLIAAVFTTTAICAVAFLLSGSIVVASINALFGVPVFLLTQAVMNRHREALLRRSPVNRETPDFYWDVIVNDVSVGSISDSELAEIQASVASDWRTVIRQGLSFLNAASIAVDKMLQVIPAAAFWIAFAYATLDIKGFTAMIEAVHDQATHNPTHLFAVIGQLFLYAAMITIVFMVVFMHTSFGARNVARDDVVDQVRRKLRVAARGEMRLFRQTREGDLWVCENTDPFDWFSNVGRNQRRTAE